MPSGSQFWVSARSPSAPPPDFAFQLGDPTDMGRLAQGLLRMVDKSRVVGQMTPGHRPQVDAVNKRWVTRAHFPRIPDPVTTEACHSASALHNDYLEGCGAYFYGGVESVSRLHRTMRLHDFSACASLTSRPNSAVWQLPGPRRLGPTPATIHLSGESCGLLPRSALAIFRNT